MSNLVASGSASNEKVEKYDVINPPGGTKSQKIWGYLPDQQNKTWSVVRTIARVSRRQIAAHGARKLMLLFSHVCVLRG